MGGFKLRSRYDLAGSSRGRARLLTQRKKGAHEGPRQALPRRSPGAQGHVQSTELRPGASEEAEPGGGLGPGSSQG